MNNDIPKRLKIPQCKYAKPHFYFYNTETSGWMSGEKGKIITDLRGYWHLIDIQCTVIDPEDKSLIDREDRCPFIWCRDSIEDNLRCMMRQEGDPKKPVYTITPKHD